GTFRVRRELRRYMPGCTISDTAQLELEAFMRKCGSTVLSIIVALSWIAPYSRGQSPNKKPVSSDLIQALNRREFANAKSLIQRGAEPNSKDAQNRTALMYAVFRDQLDLVELLIAKGSRVNDADNEGKNALFYAAAENHLEIVRTLLKHGADPNVIVPKEDLSPISVAASGGKFDLVKLLLDNGSKIDLPGRRDDTPLITALRKGN